MRARSSYTASIHNTARAARGGLLSCCCRPFGKPRKALRDKWPRSPWPREGRLEMEEPQDLISSPLFQQPTQVSANRATFAPQPGWRTAAARRWRRRAHTYDWPAPTWAARHL